MSENPITLNTTDEVSVVRRSLLRLERELILSGDKDDRNDLRIISDLLERLPRPEFGTLGAR